MSNNKELLKSELKELFSFGRNIYYNELISNNKIDEKSKKEIIEQAAYEKYKKENFSTKFSYQNWFTKSYSIVKSLLPDRHLEFYNLYINDKRKEITYSTYTINDYWLNIVITRGFEKIKVFDPLSVFIVKMEVQLSILKACLDLIDSKLNDIEGVLQYELFENELQAAKNLCKKKYLRAAGTLAGVTLETHLSKVCKNRNIKLKKKDPTISDFNEELKKENIIDVPTWRLIQRLGDIRNMSTHSKEREPTIDEIEDLIRGVEKLIAELN